MNDVISVLEKGTCEAGFKLIFENKISGTAIMSSDGQFIRVNETFCQMTGYSAGELMQFSLFEITPEEEWASTRENLEKVIAGTKESFVLERQTRTKEGTEKWVEIKGSLLHHEQDYLLCFIDDIDEKKRTAEDLYKSTMELRLAQEVANIGSWYIDIHTYDIKWSDEMYPLLGIDKGEKPLGWGVSKLLHPDDREIFNEKMGAFQDFSNLEVRHISKKGLRLLRVNARVLYADDQPVKFYGTVQDITENRKLELRIQEAQQIAKLGWWELDLITGELAWSDFMYALTGIDKKENPLSLEKFKKILHPDDVKWMDMDMSSLKDGWNNGILRYKKKGGGYSHVLTNGKVIFDGERPVKLIGTSMDVSETIEVQHKLQEVQKIAKVGWYEYDLQDPKNHKVSKELADLLEMEDSNKPVDASSYIVAMAPEDRDNFLYRLNNLHQYPDGWDNQIFRITTRSGKLLYLSGSARIAYENNQPVRIFATVYDVTQVKKYEKKIAQNEINLKALITSMENIVFVINEQMKFQQVFCNDHELLHIPAHEFLNKSIFEIWHDGPGKVIAEITEKAFHSNEEGFHTYKYTPKKKEYWWTAHVKPIQGEDNVTWVAVIINDITTERSAEEELIKNAQKEKELTEMRAQFVSMASHQFRTPLTVIKSNMELLELAGINNPVVNKVRNRLQTETDRLIELMEGVMAMGKVQSGNVQTKLEAISMPDLIYRVKMNVERHLPKSGSAEVIVSGKEKPVQVDLKYMEHALNNLIENAFKYSNDSQKPIIQLSYSEEKLRIGIRNFGIGIPEGDKHRLFTAFQRGSNADHIPGTGLGLAIAKAFVELNYGSLFLNEKQKEGTEFCIDLPLEK